MSFRSMTFGNNDTSGEKQLNVNTLLRRDAPITENCVYDITSYTIERSSYLEGKIMIN